MDFQCFVAAGPTKHSSIRLKQSTFPSARLTRSLPEQRGIGQCLAVWTCPLFRGGLAAIGFLKKKFPLLLFKSFLSQKFKKLATAPTPGRPQPTTSHAEKAN